ncbi:PREDICTED: uncharacterized protein LOC104600553 [Nelumbo nucifera]|uniref:AB hydrolase-1 domain-containing protein n=2 Tax=Nelumbo nucifera TaxID=4432 RepID=A0A822ZR05_NELNU|nr:PREDICTED: uncharacterized protein LOC104600553 [Nelumbo nucifera]DAD44248.1 TPA_asm: hypothetical protein HUJ06_002478 [Nelumbo nucifera]
MVSSCLSIVSLYAGYLRRCFIGAGLLPQTIDIDSQTIIHFWGPNSNSSVTKKPPLVLIHGFGSNALFQWRRQVQALYPYFDLYVPDLIFFGGSTTKSSERSEIFQVVSIGKLLDKLGVGRFSVMGTSYGGFVAYHMASMWPDRVDKVVIASSGVNKRRGDIDELMERANVKSIEDLMLPKTAAQLRTLLRLAVFKPPPVLPDFLLNDYVQTMCMENRKEKLELLKGITLGQDDTVCISPLPQDVLIVWGEHDQLFPVEMGFELKELLGKKARFEVLKNTSHVPQIEDSAKFNDIVKKFFCGSS